jgi:MFS superfamily sulfate permease-like transporter
VNAIEMQIDTQTVAAADSAARMLEKCVGYRVVTQVEYVTASDTLKEIKTRGKQLDDLRRSMTKPLDDSKAKIMDFFRKPAEALAEAEKEVKSAMLRFQQEQERERLAEIRRQEEDRRLEQEILDELAQEAAQAGDVVAVAELVEQKQEAMVAPVVAPPSAPKVDGVGMRKVWKWRLVDYLLVPREYLMLDDVMIGNVVRGSQGKLTIPGIEIYSKDVVISRGI